MVFSGRPSTACHACRAKRLKCDRKIPGCSQCLRKGLACSGYPDPTALRVRDETRRTAKKVDAVQQVGRKSQSQSPPSTNCDYVVLPQKSLLPNLDDDATTFFFTSYLVGTPFEDYLADFFAPGQPVDETISMAVSASTHAAYSRHARSPQQLTTAYGEYAVVLNRVNKLLQNPDTAVLDTTLALVLLLGLFEAIVFPGGNAPTSWNAHTLGAMRLLLLRGPDQCASKLSQRLYVQTCNNIRTSCIQRAVAIPEDFAKFTQKLESVMDPSEPGLRFSVIIRRIANLKARSRLEPDTNHLDEALELDDEMMEIARGLFVAWPYTAKDAVSLPRWVRHETVYEYSHIRGAKVWTALRLLRLYLLHYIAEKAVLGGDAQTIIANMARGALDTLSAPQRHVAIHMAATANDILATIPCFLEQVNGVFVFSPAARSMAWPLNIMDHTPICKPWVRTYSTECLERLAGDLNMPQAVHEARDPSRTDDWFHIFHLA